MSHFVSLPHFPALVVNFALVTLCKVEAWSWRCETLIIRLIDLVGGDRGTGIY